MNLETLSLLNVDIRTDGAAAIGTLCGGGGRRCSKLQIEKSKFTRDGCAALAAKLCNECEFPSSRSQLAEVRLIGCSLGQAGSTGTSTLAQALGKCCGLKTLFMVDVGLQDADVVAFAEGVLASTEQGHNSTTSNRTLETLLLHNNMIGDRGACIACS